MPRVLLREKEYQLQDFVRFLRDEMRHKGFYDKDVADWLGITQQGANKKFKSGSFKLKEILILIDRLNPDDEELLKRIRRKKK